MRFAPAMLLLLAFLPSPLPAQRQHKISNEQRLPDQYKKWLNEDVVYIISDDERKEFLRLPTDTERDKFIDAFWVARNPDPSPQPLQNAVKEEHYRRLAYVRDNFGDPRYNDGWRTDMGHVYIVLGPPQQRAQYHIGISTRPVEIWFYQSPSPALPPYFNLVFYKRGDNDPYTLYSPLQDGPNRIVTNDASGTTPAAALKVIMSSMGAEAAHAMVTLFPSESASMQNPQFSMSSDLLISQVKDLADQKLEKDRIRLLKHMDKERITASIFTGGNAAELETALLRDSNGRDTVHFLLRNQQLDQRLVGLLPSKQTGYSLSLQTRVTTSDGKAVYQQQDTLQGAVSEMAAKTAREKLFGAEGRLPVVPGNYEVETTLTNNLTHEASRVTRKFTVPALNPGTVGISDLVAYTASPFRNPDGQLPFSVSNVRFTPRGVQTVQIHAGEKLPLMFQIWFPAADLHQPYNPIPKQVHVHYLVGTVGAGQSTPHEEDEDVDVANLDAAGNLLTGHTIDTSHLEQGTYRLVAKVTEPGTPRSAFATMTVKVLPPEVTTAMWTAYGPEAQHQAWQEDVERGVAAQTLGQYAEAAACYRRALAAHPDDESIKSRLDAVTKAQGASQAAIK